MTNRLELPLCCRLMLHFAEISRQVSPGAHAAVVFDGAGYHIAKDLTVPENVTLIKLPPRASELNPVENVWEYLRGNRLAVTVFDSYDDIVNMTCHAWDILRQRPRSHRIHHQPIMGDGQCLGALV
jgi:transposase